MQFNYRRDNEDKTILDDRAVKGLSHIRKQQHDERGHPVINGNGATCWTGNANIDFGTANTVKIQISAKSSITVASYFQHKYGITLKFPNAILVNFGSDERPNFLPPELGIVQPGQGFIDSLMNTQTSRMIRIASRGPAENARRIVGAGSGHRTAL